MAGKHFVGADYADFTDSGKSKPVSGVVLIIDSETSVTAGDDSGYVMRSECPFATQAMADTLLKRVLGYRFQMYSAEAARLDPAAELGDAVDIGGVYGIISHRSDDGSMFPDISAVGEEELEEDYPTEGPLTRELKRNNRDIRSFITKTAKEIREEISSEVDGLSAFIDVQLGIIDEQVNGLDGRLGEVEITAESVTERVNGLDDAYAELYIESGKISQKVNGLDGRMTLVEETAEGFTRNIEGLDGRFLKIEETVKGVTYTDDKGRVMINNGCLDLTGAITFSDLDSSTQSAINSKSRTFRSQPAGPYYVGDVWYKADGTVWRCKKDEAQKGKFNASDWEQVTEDVGTVITKFLVDSPKIRGADICGAAYHDINELVNMELVPYEWEGDLSAGLTLAAKDGSQIFKITPNLLLHQDTGKLDYTGANLFLGDLRVLSGVLLDSEDISQLITFGSEKASILLTGKTFFVPHPDDIDGDPITFDLTGSNIDLSLTHLTGNVVSLGTSWTATTAEQFNLFLVVGKPGSGSSMVSVLIPKKALGNKYQLADNISYLAFTLNLGGVTINSNPSGGSIVGVYGIK